MEEIRNEQLNLRLFYLLLLKKLWVVVFGAALGLVAGALIYMAAVRVTQPELYRGETRFYLHFVENGTHDTVYDYYNSYTWHELIEGDTMIALIREELPDSGSDFTDEDLKNILDTEMPSDIRLLHVRVTDGNIDTVELLTDVMTKVLPVYGEQNEVFRRIEHTETIVPFRVTYPERRNTAAVTGAVVGALLTLCVLVIALLTDDATHVPEEAESRYGLPVLCMLPETVFAEEEEEHLREVLAGGSRIRIFTDPKEQSAQRVEEMLRTRFPELIQDDVTFVKAGEDADIALVAIAQGKTNGTMHAHLIAEAKQTTAAQKGILLTDTKEAFLKRYYRIKE